MEVMENTTKTLQIKNSGYYESSVFGGKMVKLKEGEVLHLIGHDHPACWECRTDKGKTVFVEFENGKVLG